MAFTYKWSDLIGLVSKQVKNAPTSDIDHLHCDFVSSEMATILPWTPLVTTIPDGTVLEDGNQDYSVPPEIYRMVEDTVYLLRTDVTPNETISLQLVDQLPVDLGKRSVYAIRNIAHQPGVGQLRLEYAVHVPAGNVWEIRGNYQVNPTKVTATSASCWFDDKYAPVAIEGLTYWAYKLMDDPRAGSATETGEGRVVYSGQLGTFMARIRGMRQAEDLGGGERIVPADPLGAGNANGFGIFGW